MVQVLDYMDVVESTITYLQAENTGTADYDLSLSLPTAVLNSNIVVKDLEIVKKAKELMERLKTKSKEKSS